MCYSFLPRSSSSSLYETQDKSYEYLGIYWQPPSIDWCKVNVDGCSLGNSVVASLGGVIHSHRSIVLMTFAEYLGINTNFKTEQYGVLRGIREAMKLGFQRIWLESDSGLVVSSLRINNVPWYVKQIYILLQ
ncbi:hypothetical protein NE237_019822 [Protea cynaroides]|uniref:RNase H type-1 domain-containing protein n=1 Tax=Protea cynaroides TaxID=273540 RepID=A0A9Q0K215_9MAGN|nr:hypothetical protein NE237_019822 [Protea cynaroides]